MTYRVPPYPERALFLLFEQAKQWPVWLIHAAPVVGALIGEYDWKTALVASVFLLVARPLYGALSPFGVAVDEIEF